MNKLLYIAAALALLAGCTQKEPADAVSIAVFVPGVTSGNAVYQMLADGVQAAAQAHSAQTPDAPVQVSVIEAGTNQAEWSGRLTAVAASGEYDVIISSNPSMPDIAVPLTQQFPEQKFILLDAYCEDNGNIFTVRYNQREQAYLTGYMAGLVTTASHEQMPYANEAKTVGLIAAQEYPVMNDIILPSFIEGLRAVDSGITVDFRIVGNWYDATKAAELARSMHQNGADVILPIAGGAAQGVIAAAQEESFYITWFDDNGFAKAPGYIISSTVMHQDKMAQEAAAQFLAGNTPFGSAQTVGIEQGYIDFITDDPLYESTVNSAIRQAMQQELDRITSGELQLPSP